jgi:hypothetical protein
MILSFSAQECERSRKDDKYFCLELNELSELALCEVKDQVLSATVIYKYGSKRRRSLWFDL